MFQHWLGVSVEEGKGVQYPWKQERTVRGYNYLDTINQQDLLIQISENPLSYHFFSMSTLNEFLPKEIDYENLDAEIEFDLSSKLPFYYTISNPEESIRVKEGVHQRWGLIQADPWDYRLDSRINSLGLGYIYMNPENNRYYEGWSFYNELPNFYDKIYDNSHEQAWQIY
jgi:hypothetical protein